MDVRVAPYEEWMRAPVAELFHQQYGGSREAFLDRFERFYEHPYQRDRCIRVAAVDGDRVAGFVAACFWPYFFEGRRCDSFQVVDVLVGERYRGRGLLQRMLLDLKAEFLVAFPVRALAKIFLRDGWGEHVLDLQWSVRILNPFAFLFPEKTFRTTRPAVASATSGFRLTSERDFLEWRDHYAGPHEYFESRGVVFELKRNRRKRLLRELIVGDVRASEGADIAGAFDDLARAAGRRVSFLSVAANDAPLRKINRTIPFFVKRFSTDAPVTDPSKWTLYRSDIDTW